jgi:hypothetical protein
MRALAALTLIATLLGCGSDKKEEQQLPAACGNEDVRVDGACVPTGVPAARCGTGLRADARGCVVDLESCPNAAIGGCLTVGIATCAAGFARDGELSCKPILPSTACTAGTLALPGDTTCRAVDTCADVTGDLFVDVAAEAGGDGTRARPFRTISDAIAAASDGKTIAVADGVYTENVVNKPLTLIGRCTGKVQLTGADGTKPVVHFTNGKSVLRSVALTGTIDVGAANVTLSSLWIHDVDGTAVRTANASVTALVNVLVEGAKGYGLAITGGTASVDGVVVRGTRPLDTGDRGIGVTLDQSSSGQVAKLNAKQLLLDGNADVGLMVHGSEAVIEQSVIINTKPRANGSYGVGINALAYSAAAAARGNTIVRDSFIAGNTFAGLFVGGAPVTVERTVIRENKPQPLKSLARGIIVQEHPGSMHRGELTMKNSVVEQNMEVAIAVSSSTALLEDTIVRGTRTKRDGTWGLGVMGQVSTGRKDGAEITLRRSLVEDNREIGVYGNGGKITLDQSIVRGTRPSKSAGWGVHVVDNEEAGVAGELTMTATLVDDNVAYGVFTHLADVTIDRSVIRATTAGTAEHTTSGVVATHSTLTLTGSIIEDNEETNLLLLGSRATLDAMTMRKPRTRNGIHGVGMVAHVSVDGTPSDVTLGASLIDGAFAAGLIVNAANVDIDRLLVRDVVAEPATGKFGDGVVVRTINGARGTLKLRRSAVMRVARASVSAFGSDATLSGCLLACAAFSIDVEPLDGQSPALLDEGGNNCGCTSAAVCRALSSSLEPISVEARTGAR